MASMNRNKLKAYAPEARRNFIQAMKDRAAFYGLTESKIEPAVVHGDVAVIAGLDHPRSIADKRKKHDARVERDGFEQTMEAMACTWFNRLVAIRFMELHGYLDHGYRVLSHPEGETRRGNHSAIIVCHRLHDGSLLSRWSRTDFRT